MQTADATATSSGTESAAGIAVLRFAVLAGLLGGLTRTWADPDLWGHLRYGADILHNGGLTPLDPYSFTSDRPWINHEWLAEIVMRAAWAAGGAGLIALKMAIVAATLALVVSALRDRDVPAIVRDGAVAAALFGLWARVFVIRPQLFSVLLFATLLWTLARLEHRASRAIWLIPVIFGLWVNLHGGWIVGCATLLLWAAGRVAGVGAPGMSRGTVVAVTALSFAATLFNPYGIGLWTWMAETVRLERPDINDWRPLLESGAPVIVPWLMAAALAIVALARGRSRVPIVHAAIVLGLGAASLRVNRLDVFFTLSTVMLLTPYVSAPATPVAARWSRRTRTAAMVVTVVLLAWAWRARADASCVRLDGPWMPEREAGAFVVANHLQGRLLTWFDWGQYAIWHFAPSLKVSIDGRRETVYAEAFIARHLRLYEQPDLASDFLASLRTDYAWLPRALPLVAALQRNGWHTLYAGPISVVLGKERLPQPAVPATLAPACFPGP